MVKEKQANKYPIRASWFLVWILIISSMPALVAESKNGKQTVRLGEWNISSYEFNAGSYRGAARKSDGSQIDIEICMNAERFNIRRFDLDDNSRTFEVKGLGKAKYRVDNILNMQQVSGIMLPICLRHVLRFTYKEQHFAISTMEEVTRKTFGSIQERRAFIKSAIAKAQEEAPPDELVSFAKLLVGAPVEFRTYRVATEYPTVEAAVEGGKLEVLKRSSIFKEGDYGWYLHARPGQSAKFRIRFPAKEFTVTSQGIEATGGSEVLAGNVLTVNDRKAIFDEKGIALVEYGEIENGHMLRIEYDGWQRERRTFSANIFLRWGRPEEEWLNGSYFPLAPKLENPTVEACIRSILRDLEIAHDPDRDCWVTSRGQTRGYIPSWNDIAALEGLELRDFPRLQSIDRQDLSTHWVKHSFERYFSSTPNTSYYELLTLELAKAIQDRLANPRYGAKLWEDIRTHRKDDPSGWHSPQSVYNLAYFWEHFPQLRDGNPLQCVLDYWVNAMEKNPDPVCRYGKGATSYAHDQYPHAYALAALHIGYKVFKKEEYLKARDRQMERLKELFEQKGFLNAISSKDGWVREPDKWHYQHYLQPICEAVALYGQACAFIDDKDGLTLSREWITAALAREGQEGKNPFHNYQAATFKDRCGMLAVLRGKAAYLMVPIEEQIE